MRLVDGPRGVRVDMEMLCMAMEDGAMEHSYILDTQSGEVIFISELTMDSDEIGALRDEIDSAEPGRYLEVPRADSHAGYRDMEDFIATLDSLRLRVALDNAIRGRGAFRRYKDALRRYPDARQRWFDFKAVRLEARAREWLALEGCEPIPIGRPV